MIVKQRIYNKEIDDVKVILKLISSPVVIKKENIVTAIIR